MKMETYKGRLIKSNPYPLSIGKFSSNGIIQTNTDEETLEMKFDALQATVFQNENEADIFFIEGAKKLIDTGAA